MIKYQIEPITQLKDWLFANKIGEVGENLIESESRSFWTMTFCGDKVRKGCVDSAAAFVAKEKEGENDFCLSLVTRHCFCHAQQTSCWLSCFCHAYRVNSVLGRAWRLFRTVYTSWTLFGTTLGATRAATPCLASYRKIRKYLKITRDLVLNTI